MPAKETRRGLNGLKGRIDPLEKTRDAAILIFLLLCASVLMSLIILKFPTHFDEGISLYGAVRVLKGHVPYRDFFHNTTPGAASLLALVFSATGISMLPARLVIAFYGLGLMALIYLLGRKFVKNPLAAALPPILFFILDVFPNGDYTTHRPGMFFAMVALGSLAGVKHGWGVFLAGVCGGASFLMNQNIGACALLGMGVLALTRPSFSRERPVSFSGGRNLAILALGALLVILPLLAVLSIRGAIEEFFSDTVLWPLSWYRSFNRYPYFSFELTLIRENLRQIAEGHCAPVNFGEAGLYLFTGFLPLIVYPTALAASFFRKEWVSFSLSTMGMGLLLSSSNHPDYLHVLRSLVPLYPLAAFLLVSLWKEGIHGHRLALAPFAVILLLSVLSFLDGILFLMTPMGSPSFPVATPRGTLYSATDVEAGVNEEVIRHIMSTAGPGEPIFVYHWSPELYFLCNRDNPTRFDTYKPLYTTPDQLEELKRQLQRYRPRLIVKDNYISSFSDPHGRTHSTFPFVDPRRLLTEDPVDQWISGTYRVTRTINIYRFLEPIHPARLRRRAHQP